MVSSIGRKLVVKFFQMKNYPKRKFSQLNVSKDCLKISLSQQLQLKGGDGDGDIGIEDYIDG